MFSSDLLNSKHQKAYLHAAVWIAGASVGVAAVLFARLTTWAQVLFMSHFNSHPYIISALTPLLFLVATWLVQKFAPEAKGSGIPQVLEAIEIAKDKEDSHLAWSHQLVSIKTAFIKIISATVGVLGGASIGREGPTVQIAASLFAWIGDKVRKIYPSADFSSFLTTGAAAGVAAAFNTPLAGITFALEEIAEEAFSRFKRLVIIGVVVAGVTAQGLAGNYLYFSHPSIASATISNLFLIAIPVSVLSGLLGGAFARSLAHPPPFIALPKKWWVRALLFGAICSAIGLMTHGDTAGSGYEVSHRSLESLYDVNPGLFFPIWKFITTSLSYLTGMAGGIFSPCLSIGAGIGFSFASLAHLASGKACALLGMVAFFSAVVQAPLTAVVIVMEMTDQHALILPFMAAAFIAQAIGKRFMPVPLYRFLAMKGNGGV